MTVCYTQKCHSDWRKSLTEKRFILCSSFRVAKGRLQARKVIQPHLRLDIMYFCNPFTNTVKTRKSFRNSKHKFTKDRSFLTNLTALNDEMAGYGDKGRAVDIRYLNFHKAFDTIFHSFPNCRLRKRALDEVCIRCTEN